MVPPVRLVRMQGTISSCGFARGDRLVVGAWSSSPIGPTVDIMWADPDGMRTLVAPDEATAEFVTSVYDFDRVEVVAIEALARPRSLDLVAGDLSLRLRADGAGFRLPPRPRWATRWIERPGAWALMRVRTFGTSPTGVREWYQARACRFVTDGSASLRGQDLGALTRVWPPCRFGFSEPPARPSIVEVEPTLGVPGDWPAGRPQRAPQPLW